MRVPWSRLFLPRVQTGETPTAYAKTGNLETLHYLGACITTLGCIPLASYTGLGLFKPLRYRLQGIGLEG